MSFVSYCDTPLGMLKIVSDGKAVKEIALSGTCVCRYEQENEITRKAVSELSEYFSGNRREFTLPLSPDGTVFEQAVWRELLKIPFGKSKSYGEIAAALGKSGASRAVGNAVGKNPLLIVIPCHRVIAANHRLGGFSAGIENKRFLLSHEGISVVG